MLESSQMWWSASVQYIAQRLRVACMRALSLRVMDAGGRLLCHKVKVSIYQPHFHHCGFPITSALHAAWLVFNWPARQEIDHVFPEESHGDVCAWWTPMLSQEGYPHQDAGLATELQCKSQADESIVPRLNFDVDLFLILDVFSWLQAKIALGQPIVYLLKK